jgi:acetyl esterase
MPLHPQVEQMRRQREREGTAPLYTLSLAEARAADLAAIRAVAGDPEPVAAVSERAIFGDGPDLRIRVYEPDDTADDAGRLRPVLVYYFGGGWTLGSLDTCDAICRALTNAVRCVTVSVQYRLAPEHPFPAAVEDCYTGLLWAAEHAADLRADADRLAVGGDSAGGNLAAAVTLLARERGGPRLRHQLLVYPNTDYASDTPSMREAVDPLLFNRWSVDWYWNHYLADPRDGQSPLASPLRAADLAGLPPATVLTAEFDPLRDQGEQYAQRLREAGIPVEARRYEGMPHGFFAMGGVLNEARASLTYAADRLNEAFDADLTQRSSTQ